MKIKSVLIADQLEPVDSEITGKGGYYLWVKRIFDIVFAAFVLLVTSPVIVLCLIAVKLTSQGPVFYRAKRAGLGGRSFYMLKIRTMHAGADTPNRRITEIQDDRITVVGSLLRRFKIDEIPQLWNVLRGDMSIIGPRPEDYDIVIRHFTAQQKRMLTVRPGVASPVDVRWYPDLTYHDPPRDGVAIQEWYLERHLPVQLAEGLHYVDRQCLLLDLKVLVQTVFCVLVHSWLPPKQRNLSQAALTDIDNSRAIDSIAE